MGGSLGIVLCDGQPLFLDALRAVLVDRGHEVLSTVTTRRGLLEEIERVRPELCVTDSELPDGDGIDAVADVLAISPTTKVVVLTADGREAVMQRALAAGARGFAHKSRGLPAVLSMLERVAAAEHPVLLPSSPGGVAGAPQSQHQMARHLASFLTPRELECLELLAAGLDTLQIGRRLGVSSATVRSHVQSVLNKLGVRTRMEAATLAIRYGLIKSDTSTSHA